MQARRSIRDPEPKLIVERPAVQDHDDIASEASPARSRPAGTKPATIREVAALAGVSHQTVSRFLNQDTAIRAASVEKIKQAMAALHYSPNLAARALRSQRKYRVVVMAPDVSQYFPINVLSRAAETAQLAGYRVDLMALEGTAEERMARMETMLAGDDLAGVLSFFPLPAEITADAAITGRVPIVVSGSYDGKMRASGSFADGTAILQIVKYLHDLGHRDFFHVAGPAEWSSASNRMIAYEKAIADLGVRSHGMARGDWSAESGYRAATQVLSYADVSAVVVANDQMAMGLMRALHENGIDVPGAMSVFGWDDMAEARYFVPSLSTVRMDLAAQGAAGMSRLIALIRGEEPQPELLLAPKMELVFRESCAPARRSSTKGTQAPPT